jgi:1-acyl-sn-glycerol-3-phosphate acyltransferase
MKFLRIPIRIIQVIVIFLCTAIAAILGITLMLLTRNGSWVHKVTGYYFWAPIVCGVCGVRVKLHHGDRLKEEDVAIYVANHSSLFDIVAIARTIPIGLFFVAKKELARLPFMGQYMWLIGHIFVDRKNRDQAMKSMKRAAEIIKGGRNVISFPEGTRSKSGDIGLFKRGSFLIAKEGGIDIVPIGIVGAREVLASGSFDLNPGTIHVIIGERITASQAQDLSTEELAELARKSVVSLTEKVPS